MQCPDTNSKNGDNRGHPSGASTMIDGFFYYPIEPEKFVPCWAFGHSFRVQHSVIRSVFNNWSFVPCWTFGHSFRIQHLVICPVLNIRLFVPFWTFGHSFRIQRYIRSFVPCWILD